ncbi:lysophospholipid acyltransferase family protein [Marininema halotolerans]|uniref:1-acyl-sn-glycerol-3-phosphate acyltransferase n=1 Tax=Marininema halotolerans TaxID=1155944 RepID=A0A1I6PA74_9BACL|nr:lysophospholipid acyltransferase family protein [Marininema halotolerans]SFS37079.1 1-acyl-sn-glycerol-3-phosphate acyltransferase [Marininema halotolerans]
MWYTIAKNLVAFVLRFYHRVEVTGASNIPKTGPLILVGNHVSYIDPFYIGGSFPRKVHYMAKKESFSHPVLNTILTKLESFPVQRGKTDLRAIRTAFAFLKEGEVVGMFPEGSRRDDHPMEEIKQGAAYIALKSKAQLLPVYIEGTSQALPRHAKWIRPARVTIRYGSPISVDPSGGRREQERLSNELLHALHQLAQEKRNQRVS